MSNQVEQGELLALLEGLGNQQSKHGFPDRPRLLIISKPIFTWNRKIALGNVANSFVGNSSPRLGNFQ